MRNSLVDVDVFHIKVGVVHAIVSLSIVINVMQIMLYNTCTCQLVSPCPGWKCSRRLDTLP